MQEITNGIKLQRTTDAQTLAKYREKGTTPIYLYDLKKDMESRGADLGYNQKKTYYYTIFIDEYYYDTPPTDKAAKKWTDKSHYWKYFVNKENRKLLLFLSPQYSADKEVVIRKPNICLPKDQFRLITVLPT